MASKKLRVRAKRLFLSSGAEISDVDELQNNDTLYISQGEAFYKSFGDFTNVGAGIRWCGQKCTYLFLCEILFCEGLEPVYALNSGHCWARCTTIAVVTVDEILDFESLRGQWMIDKDGYVFVYIMDSRFSLHVVLSFHYINESRRPLPPIILVDNKKDVVELEPIKCQSTDVTFIQCALYRDERVHRSKCNGVFETFVREVRRKKVPKPKNSACFLL
ncbi:hypothetical protein PsorP6_016579 [Peronosclerospora sorghi]|uniref:Uncharacterized protein n=1 Tax=Peronosclerospora sorghi TaxID=230839 RepID=A0ACC0VQI0_9STRA|nr:hypothetical protein PsorP6_016579 [Peronosclerospora sorghi]